MKALLFAMAAAVAAGVCAPAHANTMFYVRCDSCSAMHTNPTTQAAAVGALSSGGAVVGDEVGVCKQTSPTTSIWVGYVVTSAPVTSSANIAWTSTLSYVDMGCF